MEKKEAKKELLQWHPAFYAGLQIEFADEAKYLKFENEHMLGSKPMQIDVLIIKKESARQIKKNIGRIFRVHNIVEYKSPKDSLVIDDFYKVLGYACFYKSDTKKANEVEAGDITVSFVCHRYPRELLKYLARERHCRTELYGKGIYYVYGAMFPVQIIVTKQLPEEENLWLRSLTYDLEKEVGAEKLLRVYEKHQTEKLYQSVMDVIVRANEERFKVSGMCEALEELMRDRIEELERKAVSRGLEQGIKQGVEQGLEQGIKQGVEQGIKQGVEQGKKQGVEQGIKQGVEQGIKQGVEQGIKQGVEQGIKQGVEQGIKQGMEQGISQGISQGRQQTLLALIRKKIERGKSLAQIADELEETQDAILPLYNQLKTE